MNSSVSILFVKKGIYISMSSSLNQLTAATYLVSSNFQLKREDYFYKDCKDQEGTFTSLPVELIINIIGELTLKELALSRLVSKSWEARENHISLKLFLMTTLKGHKTCAKINKTYKKWLVIPRDKEKAFTFFQKQEQFHFARVLFEVGATCFFKEEDETQTLVTHLFKEAASKECAKSELALALFYSEQEERENLDNLSINHLKKAADKGLLDAQYCLFFLYKDGFGVKKDLNRALKYLEAAIIQTKESPEYPDSLYMLAQNYKKALETEKDFEQEYFKKAKEYIKLSANLGSKKSIAFLADDYLSPKNPKRNYKKALNYLFKAWKAKQIFAGFEILKFYAFGIVIKQDKEKAQKYFNCLSSPKRIKELNNTFDKGLYYFNLGVCYKEGIGTNQDIQKALHFFKRATVFNNKYAGTTLGNYYQEIDFRQAIYYYSLSLEQDSAEAAFGLILVYSKVHIDQEKAKKYFEIFLYLTKKGNDNNEGANLQMLSRCYFEGLGVPKNERRGNFYLKEAANKGDAFSQFELCKFYSKSDKLELKKNAEKYFLLLSDDNHPQYTWKIKERYEMIGECYLKGLGVEKSETLGEQYLALARSLNDQTGQKD